ncbi:MAG: hypothetical protein M1835_006074, partial [Candelina submexicana]
MAAPAAPIPDPISCRAPPAVATALTDSVCEGQHLFPRRVRAWLVRVGEDRVLVPLFAAVLVAVLADPVAVEQTACCGTLTPALRFSGSGVEQIYEPRAKTSGEGNSSCHNAMSSMLRTGVRAHIPFFSASPHLSEMQQAMEPSNQHSETLTAQSGRPSVPAWARAQATRVAKKVRIAIFILTRPVALV